MASSIYSNSLRYLPLMANRVIIAKAGIETSLQLEAKSVLHTVTA